MERKLILVKNAVRQNGLLETVVHLVKTIWGRFFVLLTVSFLKIRGYDVPFSISLSGQNDFFQSTRRAIKIGKNVKLRRGTSLRAGFNGKIIIGDNVLVEDYVYIMAQKLVSIGKNTQISAFCFITDFNHRFTDSNRTIKEQGYETKPVVIGEDVWMGTGCIILPGVFVGKGAVIGAGSVVTKNIPSYSVAVGNPAKVIKKRS